MSKITIRVDSKTGQTYLPRDIRRDGFTGEIEGLANALTITLIKPGANLSDVEKSLHIILDDITLRRQQERIMRRAKKNTGKSRKVRPERKESAPRRLHPLFKKYTRAWLHGVTGYSEGYLSRIATGNIPLSRAFTERLCLKLNEPEEVLFLPEGAEGVAKP